MTAQETPQGTSADAPAEKKEEKVDLRNLQDKFHALLDQRNEYNDLAREARDARNLLNEQRREKSEVLEVHKKAREAANETMRAAKERRNAYQDQAKALIAQKQGKKGALERSLPLRVRKLRNEIEAALERQETTVLTPEKERALLDDVKHKSRELKELEAQMKEQKAIAVDLDDTDKAIDQLFARADDEHEQVKAANAVAREHHAKFVAAIKEIRVIQGEADAKHKEFIALRQKADGFHEKAMELREKVMAIRKDRRDDYNSRKAEIRDVNDRARQRVDDPEGIKRAQDDALEALKKGGKISL